MIPNSTKTVWKSQWELNSNSICSRCKLATIIIFPTLQEVGADLDLETIEIVEETINDHLIRLINNY